MLSNRFGYSIGDWGRPSSAGLRRNVLSLKPKAASRRTPAGAASPAKPRFCPPASAVSPAKPPASILQILNARLKTSQKRQASGQQPVALKRGEKRNAEHCAVEQPVLERRKAALKRGNERKAESSLWR